MRKPLQMPESVRLLPVAPVPRYSLGQTVQRFQKRLLLGGGLCCRLTAFLCGLAALFGSSFFSLAPRLHFLPTRLDFLPTLFGGSLFSLAALFRFLPALFRYFLHERSHHFHHLVVAVPFAQEKHDVRTSDDGYSDAAVDEAMVEH